MSKVVIIGGYGQVGREAALALAPRLPGRVVVAGRDLTRARAGAARAGHGARGLGIDASDPAAELGDAALVLMCAETPGVELARGCLSRGIHYVDVTADSARLAALEQLDPIARDGGATGVLSVGLAPGATNLLAVYVVRESRVSPQRVETLVCLGLGDAHGPAAIEWMLEALAVDDSFAARTRFRLPDRDRSLHAFSFDFPEARTLPRTLGVARAGSWLALDPPAATLLVALGVRSGAARWLRHPVPRRALARALSKAALGPDRWVVAARAAGRQAMLMGRREARSTGIVAAEVARGLLEGTPTAGIHHIEQLFAPEEMLERLASADPAMRLTLAEDPDSAPSATGA